MKRIRIQFLAALAVAVAMACAASAGAGEIGDRFGIKVEELCLPRVFEPIRITSSSVATRPDDGVQFLTFTADSVADSTISYNIMVYGPGGEWQECSVGRHMRIAIRANQEREVALQSDGLTAEIARHAIHAVVGLLHEDETIGGVRFYRMNGTESPDSLQVHTSPLKEGPPGGRIFLVIPTNGAIEAKEVGKWYR